ncbi:hypothetical protein [Cellulomonas sp. ES6]|uniref:hypothetical protein n=1 Tax=Cellulomonas sp. ES6 TaxID=3039384 RepID=UPI0024B70736|nr:hypothetical protein [Cellulomonas sp. ES6]WHP16619.1 hypothetical protein P9841_13475 [Cellulomonas sp. ES6]
MKVRKRIAAGLIGAAMLATSTATTALASSDPGDTIAEPESAIASVSSTQNCAYIQAVAIKLEGDAATYALDDAGELVASGPDVTTDGCVDATDPGTITPMAISYGSKTFTLASPSYSKSDTNGIFSSQVTYGNTRSLAWAYSLSPALKAISTGNATATVSRAPGNCSYHKTGVTTAYLFHGSCPTHAYSTAYTLNGAVSFPIQVAGVNGTADVAWTFNYRISSL